MRRRGLAALFLLGLCLMAWPAAAGEKFDRSPGVTSSFVTTLWERLCEAVPGLVVFSGQLGQATAASEGGGTMDPNGQPRVNGGGTMDPDG